MLKGVKRASLVFGIGFVAVSGAVIIASSSNFAQAANSASMDASVNINPSLTLTIPSSTITMNLDPATHAFDEKDLSVSVGTNNLTGYQLRVTTVGDATTLVNTADSTKTIPNLSSSSSAADFPANYWGYRLSNGSTSSGNYGQFTSPTLVSESDGPVNDITKTLGFAAKVDYTKPSGLYELNLNFTAVANPVPIYMQDMDPSVCTSTPTTVIDKRDDKEYTIARLADGQCWMVSDLNLAGGTKLDSEGSDVPAGYTQASPYFTLPASSTTGFDDDTKDFVYNTGNETTNQADCTSSQPCNSYYSWLAATAGGKDASGTAVTGDGYNAAYSICPKGWRLPTVTTSDAPATTSPNWKTGDFYKVATAYGANLESQYYDSSATFYNNAGPGTLPDFLLAGYYDSSAFSSGGTTGYYWSSSSSSSTYAYYLTFSSSAVRSANNYGRRRGFFVRCVLKKTMQNFTSADAASMATGDTDTRQDERDGNFYSIAKLPDGKVWMTKNLDLAGGTTLTPADSNVTTNYTLPASSTAGFDDDTKAFVYNSGSTTCGNGSPCYSYYSYVAATAGGKDADGNAVTGDGPDTAYSVCPKNWRLPKSGNQSDTSATSTTGYKKGDFYKLATAYGANLESSYYQNSAVYYQNAGPGTLPNFLLAGYYDSSGFYYGGAYGYYWSSSSCSSADAYSLRFDSLYVNSANRYSRRLGFSVRCVFGGV